MVSWPGYDQSLLIISERSVLWTIFIVRFLHDNSESSSKTDLSHSGSYV